MGGFLAGMMTGIGNAVHERNLFNLQQEIQQKQSLAHIAGEMAKDPNTPEEVANGMRQFQIQVMTAKPTEKFKKFGDMFSQMMAQAGTAQQRRQQEAADRMYDAQVEASKIPIPAVFNPATQTVENVAGPPAPESRPTVPAYQGGIPQFRLSHEEQLARKLQEMEAVMRMQGMIQGALGAQQQAQMMRTLMSIPGAEKMSAAQLINALNKRTVAEPPDPWKSQAPGTMLTNVKTGQQFAGPPQNVTVGQGGSLVQIPSVPAAPPSSGMPDITSGLPNLSPAGAQMGAGIPQPPTAGGQIQPIFQAPQAEQWQAINVKLTDGKTVAGSFNPKTSEVKGPNGIIPASQIAEFRPKAAGSEPLYPVVVNGVPTYMPRSQAAGMPAARTVFDMSGMPTTGGVQGVSLTPPPVVPASIQGEITDRRDTLQLFNDVQTLLSDPKYAKIGPLMGRITLAEVNKLGGLGASPEEIKLATELSTLMTNQAFARGGKQLTPTELKRFELNTPAMTDTIQQALGKTRVAVDILRRSYENRVKALPVRQREQMDKELLEPPKSWRERATQAKIGEIIETPRGRVKKVGQNQFEPVQ